MSNVKAIQAYSTRNPALKLVGSVMPGSANFPHAVFRIFSLACMLWVISAAYSFMGGNWHELWQPKGFFGMLALTFMFCTFQMGFKDTLNGFLSAFIGTNGHKEFNEQIGKWSMRSGHIWALMTLCHAHPSTWTDVSACFGPIMLGYFYAVMFGWMLPCRNGKGKPQMMDGVMPAICMFAAYSVYTNWLMK